MCQNVSLGFVRQKELGLGFLYPEPSYGHSFCAIGNEIGNAVRRFEYTSKFRNEKLK
jgi:hypothetical protein